MSSIAIDGDGLVAHACAEVARRRGLTPRLSAPTSSPRGPPLLLNEVCLELLDELFPELGWRAAGHLLHGRVISWAGGAVHRRRVEGLSIASSSVRELIATCSGDLDTSSPEDQPSRWRVAAGRPGRESLVAGRRVMLMAPASLHGIDPQASYMESLSDGWLFLLPTSRTHGSLQVMVPSGRQPERTFERMLRASELIGPWVRPLAAPSVWPAAPQISLPFAVPGCFRVGSSAARLDPISGEGTPFALRTSLLAATVIAEVEAGRVSMQAGTSHYVNRLALTILAHLKGCAAFYVEAFSDHLGWREELRLLREAHAELLARVQPPAPSELEFELNGYELRRRP